MEEINLFLTAVRNAFTDDSFHKITLSKPKKKDDILANVYVRTVMLKKDKSLSFTYRYKTNDQTKNYDLAAGIEVLSQLLDTHFLSATLFTNDADYTLLSNHKGHATFLQNKASQLTQNEQVHNRAKVKRSAANDAYLQLLGIANAKGEIIPSMADKFRQINKYLEIIESHLHTIPLPPQIHIVDMGSGKGYLTFALYDYLKNKKGLQVSMVGIELRTELVDFCNDAAEKCGFEHLRFVCERIEHFDTPQIDILIALHACDTATDDALFKAIVAKASLIVCAPCCHKQIRQQVKGKTQQSALLKYGIFKERQFEMVTDTLRALILEKNHYSTNIFEFVSNEHTRKNIMLIGSKSAEKNNVAAIDKKIMEIKATYQIEFHYLEKLLSN
jgi:16S rRNA G527 N7-methylase RsmG